MCAAEGVVTVATVADHVLPHKGDMHLFFYGKLQSLCAAHHNSTKKQIEQHGSHTTIGLDGYPTDPNHPVNKLSHS